MGSSLFGEAQHPSWTLAAFTAASTVASTNENPTSSLQRFGLAIALFFPVIAFIVVCLRVYGRVRSKQFAIDDAIIILAMALSIGETATTYMYIKTNFVGIHIWDVPAQYDHVKANIWNFAVQVLYNPILALVKTSMLLFLLRLGSQKPGVRWCIYALNTFNLSLMVAIFLVVIFQCHPIRFNWDTTLDGHCIDQGTFYVVTAALTIFTDVLTLAIPFWIFLDLKMPLRVKIALLFVFFLGAIVTVVSIVRLWFIYVGFFKPPSSDPTYTLGFCTSNIETNLAIVCASAPSLRGQIRAWFPRFFSSNRPSDGTPYYEDRYRLGDSSGFNEGSAAGPGGAGSRGGRRIGNGYGRGSRAHTSRTAKDGSRNMDGGTVVGDGSTGGNSIALHDLKSGGAGMGMAGPTATMHTAIGGGSPTASEEEIMSYNGIIRTTDVMVHYDEEHHIDRKDSVDSRHGGVRRSNSIGISTSVNESV